MLFRGPHGVQGSHPLGCLLAAPSPVPVTQDAVVEGREGGGVRWLPLVWHGNGHQAVFREALERAHGLSLEHSVPVAVTAGFPVEKGPALASIPWAVC